MLEEHVSQEQTSRRRSQRSKHPRNELHRSNRNKNVRQKVNCGREVRLPVRARGFAPPFFFMYILSRIGFFLRCRPINEQVENPKTPRECKFFGFFSVNIINLRSAASFTGATAAFSHKRDPIPKDGVWFCLTNPPTSLERENLGEFFTAKVGGDAFADLFVCHRSGVWPQPTEWHQHPNKLDEWYEKYQRHIRKTG